MVGGSVEWILALPRCKFEYAKCFVAIWSYIREQKDIVMNVLASRFPSNPLMIEWNAAAVVEKVDQEFPIEEAVVRPLEMTSDCCGSNNYQKK